MEETHWYTLSMYSSVTALGETKSHVPTVYSCTFSESTWLGLG